MNTLPLWFVCLCFAGLGGVVWLLIAGERSTQRRPLRLCSVCGNPAAAPMVRHGAVTCSTRCDQAPPSCCSALAGRRAARAAP